jgi:glucose-1-phosphate cytidylyltransferase
MKTIILCGGRGWRLHEETEFKPKAMVKIGEWPVLLHIMNMYAYHDNREFVLCLGYRGEMIREYFLNLYDYTNNVEVDLGTGEVRELQNKVKLDYRVAFIDTGIEADTAERVLIAAKYVKDAQFFVSYGDDVSDVDIGKLLKFHNKNKQKEGIYATITAAHTSSHYGTLWADKRDIVRKFDEKPKTRDYVNGGFMVFERKALQFLKKGEALEEGLERMAKRGRLGQFRHEGFWHAMNTPKDVQYLNELWDKGKPWVKKRGKK